MKLLRILAVVVLCLTISATVAFGQTWQPLTNQPTFNPGVRGTSSRPTAAAAMSTALGRRSPRSPVATLPSILVLPCCPTAGWSWKAENTTAPAEAAMRSGPAKALFTIR